MAQLLIEKGGIDIVILPPVRKPVRNQDKPVRNQSETIMNQDEINTNAAAGAAASAAALVSTTAFAVVTTVEYVRKWLRTCVRLSRP